MDKYVIGTPRLASRRAYVGRTTSEKEVVVIDGAISGEEYFDISLNTLEFTEDGEHVLCVAVDKSATRVFVIDGKSAYPFPFDHVARIERSQDGQRWALIGRNSRRSASPAVLKSSTKTQTGTQTEMLVGYDAWDVETSVVYNGTRGPRFERISRIEFAADGSISYLALIDHCIWKITHPTAAPADATKPARENGLYATIQTSHGDIVVKLYEKQAPITVKNFMDLTLGRKAWTDPKTGQRVRRPLYPDLTFHRVIPKFMIQGGDPMGTGQGGTDVIPDEIAPTLKFDLPGRLAMANAGPKTSSCQFFITEVPLPHLNGAYTIFGQTVEGMGVVLTIARASTKATIKKIAFERVGSRARREPAGPAGHGREEGPPATAKK